MLFQPPATFRPQTAHRPGQLPAYLLRQKQAAAAAALVHETRDPDCPPGYHLMDTATRLLAVDEIRAQLRAKGSQLGVRLFCWRRRCVNYRGKGGWVTRLGLWQTLPISVDTQRLRRHKEALEEEIAQLEEALKVGGLSGNHAGLKSVLPHLLTRPPPACVGLFARQGVPALLN